MWDAGCWMIDPLPQREWAWFLPGAANPVPRQMAVESKPLFHPEVLRQQVRTYNLSERVVDWQHKLQRWAGLIASTRLPRSPEGRGRLRCDTGRSGIVEISRRLYGAFHKICLRERVAGERAEAPDDLIGQ
jgi:hypothetical protein